MVTLEEMKRLQRRRLTGHTAQLTAAPIEKRRRRVLKWFRRHTKWLWPERREEDTKMKRVIDHEDGSRSIIDIPDPTIVYKPIPNLPIKVEPIMARPVEVPMPKATAGFDWNALGLQMTACGLFGCAVATNVWTAWGSDLSLSAIPVARGIFAEMGLFFVAQRRVIGIAAGLTKVALCALFFCFALWNGFKLQSVVNANQEQARTVQAAAALNTACGAATTTVTKDKKTTTTTKTGESAGCTVMKSSPPKDRPEVAAFAAFTMWAMHWKPSADDFDNLGMVLQMLVLQSGGVVLLLARR